MNHLHIHAPETKVAQPNIVPHCEAYAMGADDDDDAPKTNVESMCIDVWCDPYGQWQPHDEWDYADNYNYG